MEEQIEQVEDEAPLSAYSASGKAMDGNVHEWHEVAQTDDAAAESRDDLRFAYQIAGLLAHRIGQQATITVLGHSTAGRVGPDAMTIGVAGVVPDPDPPEGLQSTP